MNNKIVSVEELKNITMNMKKISKRVIATSGCFDIIHAGHIQYLEEAKRIGDVLIVLLNSDASVRNLKGNLRPIVPEDERAIVLSGLQCIEYICIFEESTPCEILNMFKPDVFVKGGDYLGQDIPEQVIMKQWGGVVEFVSLIDKCSSTNIINKILDRREEN